MWLLAFFISAFAALIATRVMIGVALPDVPDAARKNHSKVTPTSGGIGIIVGLLVGIAFAFWQGLALGFYMIFMCVSTALAGGVLGLLDDIYALGPKRKLFVMLGACGFFAVFGARIETLVLAPGVALEVGPILGGLGTVFWLLVIVNTVNFMDGANGLSMGCCAIGLAALGALIAIESDASRALLGWLACGACVGFLFWNAGWGKIFAGDSGALFVGLLCGTYGAWAVILGVSLFSVALCFLPMLVDVILTVIRRIKHRENVLVAHSQHAYQALIRSGSGHALVAWRYWGYSLMSCLAGAISQVLGGQNGWIYFVVLLGIFILDHFRLLRLAKDTEARRANSV